MIVTTYTTLRGIDVEVTASCLVDLPMVDDVNLLDIRPFYVSGGTPCFEAPIQPNSLSDDEEQSLIRAVEVACFY